jgi:predicted O-methyltransferase YrrM
VLDRSLQIIRQRRRPQDPWLTPEAVSLLEGLMRSGDKGLEWGAGRSTPWLAARMGHLISVEHNPQWAARVKGMLGVRGLEEKATLILAEDGSFERENSRYVQVAASLADGSLDFCLVDGMARDHCALAVLGKLKSGGLLVIDNINWYLPRERPSRAPDSRSLDQGPASPQWEEALMRLRSWRCIWTTDGITDTAIWIKSQ